MKKNPKTMKQNKNIFTDKEFKYLNKATTQAIFVGFLKSQVPTYN